MRNKLALILLCLLALHAGVAAATTSIATAAEECEKDLISLPAFLLENDTGAPVHLAEKGQAYFDQALVSARTAAQGVADDKGCDAVMHDYLSKWRKWHLQVGTIAPAAPADAPAIAPATTAMPVPSEARLDAAQLPALRLLSSHTLLLSLHSFEPAYAQPLAQLLREHHDDLAGHGNWIIDVRDSGGGSDDTYLPLLPWLLADESVEIGADWLVTPANIAAQEAVCPMLGPSELKNCLAVIQPVLARMRQAAPGSYIPVNAAINYRRHLPLEPHRPARVAVLIDHPCGSACEQFVLTVKQSFTVKLVGRNTIGALDYSNLRPQKLPSGRRILLYAISRSRRLPSMQVDLGGIMPDIYLPAPADQAGRDEEIVRVRRWLEGGSLQPASARLDNEQTH
jgi:hypothetical protein